VVTGGHCPSRPSPDLEAAKKKYLDERCILTSVEIEGDFAGFVSAAPDVMMADERVRFAEMGKVTAPHVLMRGFDYRMPFINSPMWEFFMSVPDEFRTGQNLYKEVLRTAWPKLFSLPLKSDIGWMRRIRDRAMRFGQDHIRAFDWPAPKMTNYMDLDMLLRNDINLMSIVHDQLMELKKRELVPWLDIDSLWARHLSRVANHADIIKMLFSLEINLKGLEKRQAVGKVIGL
jgi:hypothetical protein